MVGEVDGAQKYVDRSVLVKEKWREQALTDAGLIVVRWGAGHLTDFATTAYRLRRALADASQRTEACRGWYAATPGLGHIVV